MSTLCVWRAALQLKGKSGATILIAPLPFCLSEEIYRAGLCKPLRSPGIDSPAYVAWQSGTTTLFEVPARQATYAGRIDSLESISGLLKRLQIRAQYSSPSNRHLFFQMICVQMCNDDVYVTLLLD